MRFFSATVFSSLAHPLGEKHSLRIRAENQFAAISRGEFCLGFFPVNEATRPLVRTEVWLLHGEPARLQGAEFVSLTN